MAAEAANEMQGLQAKAQDALCPGLSPQGGSSPTGLSLTTGRTQVTEGPWRREEGSPTVHSEHRAAQSGRLGCPLQLERALVESVTIFSGGGSSDTLISTHSR